MIEFLLGKTGTGKSYLALKRIASALVESDDVHVLTNLSVDVGKLNALLKRRHPHIEPDVVGRVHFLNDDQIRRFFLYREPGNVLEMVSKEDEKNLRFPDFDGACKRSGLRILYVIDEAHIFFDAREWAQVGPTLNFFASQHRKFRCDIIFVTQFCDQVEKRLRLHAAKFTECVNFGMRKLLFWKLPKVFRTLETYKAPPCPPDSTNNYTMDLELAGCYDTSAGVGVTGGNGPEKIRRKGLPFWTLPALGAGLVGVFWFIPDLAVLGLTKAVAGDTAPASVGGSAPVQVPAAVTRTGHYQGSTGPSDRPGDSARPREVSPSAPAPAPVRAKVRGWAVRGNQALVTLDDGRTLTDQDIEFGGIARRGNAVWVDGEKLYLVEPRAPSLPFRVQETRTTGPAVVVPDYAGEAVQPTPESAAAASRLSSLKTIMGDGKADNQGSAPVRSSRR